MNKLILLFLCIIISITTEASFRVKCDIQYKKHIGWSEKYRAEITFLSGVEMKPKQYSNEVYVAIWFSQEKCAIIKLDVIHMSLSFKMKDFKSIYWLRSYIDGKQVNSNNKIMWRITAKEILGSFIDKRVSSGLF